MRQQACALRAAAVLEKGECRACLYGSSGKKRMAKITIFEDVCKGCGLCATQCPKNLLAIRKDFLNAKGYRPMGIEHPEECIGCASCARMCPDVVIEIER